MEKSQIERVLISEGYVRSRETDKLQEYVKGYESVYLKKNSDSHPLVIHGRHAPSMSKLTSLADVTREKSSVKAYHNSNMRSFDLRMNTGKKPTRYGFDFDFLSEKGLRSLLSAL